MIPKTHGKQPACRGSARRVSSRSRRVSVSASRRCPPVAGQDPQRKHGQGQTRTPRTSIDKALRCWPAMNAVCTYVYISTYIYAHTHLFMCIYIYTRIYMYMHILCNLHTHTYIHTYITYICTYTFYFPVFVCNVPVRSIPDDASKQDLNQQDPGLVPQTDHSGLDGSTNKTCRSRVVVVSYACVYIYMYTYIHIYTHTCMHAYIHTLHTLHTSTYIYICIRRRDRGLKYLEVRLRYMILQLHEHHEAIVPVTSYPAPGCSHSRKHPIVRQSQKGWPSLG